MENNKINIAEILKDCPSGMELDCTMYDNCTFDGIEDVGYTEILVKTPSGRIRLTKEGCFTHSDEYAKCVIFPKGKTNWKGFIPPCKFKDGDVVCLERHCDKVLTIAIFKGIENNYLHTYTYTSPGSICFSVSSFNIDYIKDLRFASLEEKEKLFEELEHHGYRWNLKTKTLEKLVEPKFKVGDIIQDNDGYNAANNIKNRVVLTVLRDKLLKKLDNGAYEPKNLKREKVKEVLLSFRRNLRKVGSECIESSLTTFDYI